jgi:hypothetical protein
MRPIVAASVTHSLYNRAPFEPFSKQQALGCVAGGSRVQRVWRQGGLGTRGCCPRAPGAHLPLDLIPPRHAHSWACADCSRRRWGH